MGGHLRSLVSLAGDCALDVGRSPQVQFSTLKNLQRLLRRAISLAFDATDMAKRMSCLSRGRECSTNEKKPRASDTKLAQAQAYCEIRPESTNKDGRNIRCVGASTMHHLNPNPMKLLIGEGKLMSQILFAALMLERVLLLNNNDELITHVQQIYIAHTVSPVASSIRFLTSLFYLYMRRQAVLAQCHLLLQVQYYSTNQFPILHLLEHLRFLQLANLSSTRQCWLLAHLGQLFHLLRPEMRLYNSPRCEV